MTILNSMHLQIILYYTYWLLHHKRYIQMTSNYSIVNRKIEKNNRLNKMTILNSIQLQIILHYIILPTIIL